MFQRYLDWHDSPLNHIPDDVFLSWCAADPAIRYPKAAAVISSFSSSKVTGKLQWKPIVYSIIEQAPDLDHILEIFADAIRPMSWTGSRSDVLQNRSDLLQEFDKHDNPEIKEWAKSQYSLLQEEIKKARKSEDQENRNQNERFE